MSSQILENIIFEGEKMFISSKSIATKENIEFVIKNRGKNVELPRLSTPLPTIPLKEGFIKKIEIMKTKDLSNMKSTRIGSTVCRRGYIGSWEIKNNKLYFLDIEGPFEIIAKTPLFAEWFSGLILIVSGKKLRGVNLGFYGDYEYEREVVIENGIVKSIKFIDNRQRAIDENWKVVTLKNYIDNEDLNG